MYSVEQEDMLMQRFATIIAIILASVALFLADVAKAGPAVDELYELRLEHKSESERSNGRGSSSGRDAISVKVVTVGVEGIELEYDLPLGATDEDRKKQWQFPARVLKPADGGQIRLLNVPELEARIDPWLALGNWTREACGKWIFTWNAFKIECDPQAVLQIIERFDPAYAELSDGAPYRHPAAASAAPLRRTAMKDGKTSFSTTMPIDADKVRAERAEADVVVGEITGAPKSPEQAKAERAKMQVDGTIDVTIELDSAGVLTKQTVVYRMEIVAADGEHETSVSTEVLTRKRIR